MKTLSIPVWAGLAAFAFPLSAAPKLTLEAALSRALEANREYRVSALDARSARDRVSWGRAGALPKVDLSASYTRSINDTRQERAGAATESLDGAASTSKAAGITGTWTVFEGLSSLAAHDRLSAAADLADERRSGNLHDLAARVILSYMDVVRQQTILSAIDTAVQLSRERVRITEGKYGYGSASKLEMLQAKLDLNEDLSMRLNQAVVLADVKRALNVMLARSDSLSFEVEDSIPLAPPPPFEGLRNAALEGSPAIKQAGLARTLASAGLREYTGGLFPQVGISAGYNYGLTEAEYGLIRSNEALGWNYGINVKLNIFDGFRLPDDYRIARRELSKADILFEEAKARVESSLSEADGAYRASLEILELETANLALARENVGIGMERLRLGTIASLELRAAQEQYVAAETRMVSARFQSKRAETELLRLAGRLGRAAP